MESIANARPPMTPYVFGSKLVQMGACLSVGTEVYRKSDHAGTNFRAKAFGQQVVFFSVSKMSHSVPRTWRNLLGHRRPIDLYCGGGQNVRGLWEDFRILPVLVVGNQRRQVCRGNFRFRVQGSEKMLAATFTLWWNKTRDMLRSRVMAQSRDRSRYGARITSSPTKQRGSLGLLHPHPVPF